MDERTRSSERHKGQRAEADVGGPGARHDRPAISTGATVHTPKPMLVVVDSGSVLFRTIEYELKKRYDKDYQVVSILSSKWGIKRLSKLMRGSSMPVPFSYYAAIVLGLDRDERLELAKLRFGLAFEDER